MSVLKCEFAALEADQKDVRKGGWCSCGPTMFCLLSVKFPSINGTTIVFVHSGVQKGVSSDVLHVLAKLPVGVGTQ